MKDFIPTLFDEQNFHNMDEFRVTSMEFARDFIGATLTHKEVARRIREEFADDAPEDCPQPAVLTTVGFGSVVNNTFDGYILDRHQVVRMLSRTVNAQGKGIRRGVMRYIKRRERRVLEQHAQILEQQEQLHAQAIELEKQKALNNAMRGASRVLDSFRFAGNLDAGDAMKVAAGFVNAKKTIQARDLVPYQLAVARLITYIGDNAGELLRTQLKECISQALSEPGTPDQP